MNFHRDSRIDEAKQIRPYVNELTRLFTGTHDKYRAHEKSRSVLEDISADPVFLTSVLRRHLVAPMALNAQNYPVIGINVELNPSYHLVAHCWLPLPNHETDLSTKAIHHHGNLLLTTTTTFGPGYEHWSFTKTRELDPSRELYAMKVTGRGLHPLHHTAFVDAYEPHVPMYPVNLSITLALWSSWKRTTWKDHLKRISFIQKNKEIMKQIARCTGATDLLEIQRMEYFDFYPTETGFKGMKKRVEIPLGPNEDHLQSLFHVLQQTQNDSLAPMVEQHLHSGKVRLENGPKIKQLLQDLKTGRPIEGRLSDCHRGITHTTFGSREIERAVKASEIR